MRTHRWIGPQHIVFACNPVTSHFLEQVLTVDEALPVSNVGFLGDEFVAALLDMVEHEAQTEDDEQLSDLSAPPRPPTHTHTHLPAALHQQKTIANIILSYTRTWTQSMHSCPC